MHVVVSSYIDSLLDTSAVARVLKVSAIEFTHGMEYLHFDLSLLELREMVEWESELAFVAAHYETNLRYFKMIM